ncbi:Protein MAIN-LIKE 1 [Glycine soja]|uniref:Protein MAIN-LIKE 1 n=1 Tax=Glycine soja TaxID=3848 RepID=A0A445GEL3_GLYSO|nr:Protein MAIN-LIKE 1 [Glycine soja]
MALMVAKFLASRNIPRQKITKFSSITGFQYTQKIRLSSPRLLALFIELSAGIADKIEAYILFAAADSYGFTWIGHGQVSPWHALLGLVAHWLRFFHLWYYPQANIEIFGQEHPELKLSSHERKVHSLGMSVPTIEGLIIGTGLSPLIACSVDTDDWGLLSAFVERWHRETSSFHLPVDELTITLDDVSSLLHLPVISDFHAFEPLHVDDAVQMLVDLLMVSPESARAETVQCRGPYVRLQWSATNVHVVYLEALRDLSMTERYAWGVAALVHMYDQLNDASMGHSRQLGGYITLLQIYEHFPSIAESTADQNYDEASPRACRWIATKKTVKSIRTPSYRERLDRLRIPNVCWIPYGEHQEVRDFHVRSCYSGLLRWGPVAVYYRPERVVQQFGYTQTIPALPVDSWVSYDDIHGRWMYYEDHIVPADHAVDHLPHGHVPQPRVVPQAPQTDIPHVPEPGAPSTSAEEPRHAVEVCDDIAERLERHLSLGVVTSGSSTHEVIEECLRLARSVTQDHLVYVRCRRRRRTDQA